MTSLKQRFPAFSRMLRLYPPAYYRQYCMQTLQTLADILDDTELSRLAKAKLYLASWLDLAKSIPRQRVIAAIHSASYQPSRYFRNRGIICLLLLVPALLSFCIGNNVTTTSLQLSSGSFASIWFSSASVATWLFVLPLLATINALYALGIWLVARKKHSRAKRPTTNQWGARLMLAGLLLIGLAGTGLLGAVAVTQYIHNQHVHRARTLSAVYQRQHPTLPCTLLPLASAQQIMGTPKAYMDNSSSINTQSFSGVEPSIHNQRTAFCNYGYADESKRGIEAVTHEAFSPTAQQALHDDFLHSEASDDPQLNLQPITLVGYQGSYSQQQGIFQLSLWVKGYWLSTSGPSFESASQAMQTMVKNLSIELAVQTAAKLTVPSRQIFPLPITKPSLTKNDQTQIEYAIMMKNVRVPAGTILNAHIANFGNNQASGTFNYSTGLHGTFTAQRKSSDWLVTAYKEERK